MSWVEDRYYKTNKILLRVMGVWPFHRTKWTNVYVVIIVSILISFIFVQLAVFTTHEITMDLMMNVLSLAFVGIIMLFLYCMYYFNTDGLKDIMQRMYLHWESLSDNMELTIMEDHARIAKMFTHMSSGFVVLINLVAIMSHAIPITLDIVAPINKTRGEKVHITSEYFVNHSKYYLPVVIHMTISVCVGAMSIMSISVMILSYGFHACALFKVANYRMGIVMDQTVLQMSSPEREHAIYERIIHTVNFHRTAMEFCQLLLYHLEKSFGVLTLIGVLSTSITLFRFLHAITYHANDAIEMFMSAACVFGHFVYLFFGNHIGQQITDNNSEIFDTAYNLPWYVASSNTKHLFLLLLQRGNKKFYLSLSSLFNASYEGFATLTTSSISYFTVLYSV